MNDTQGTDDTLFCPVCNSTGVAEQIERGGAVVYQCQNCSTKYDVFGKRIESICL